MSGEHPDYHIVMGDSAYELVKVVRKFIGLGWRPVGSIAIIQHADGSTNYLQPMMRWPKLNAERKSEQ